tara:strand:- start:112 stop:453 length:342 start_codon:yes stop_codon:yes gene_type:complete
MKHRRIDEGPPRAGRRPDAHLNFPIIIHVAEKPEDTVLEVDGQVVRHVKEVQLNRYVLTDAPHQVKQRLLLRLWDRDDQGVRAELVDRLHEMTDHNDDFELDFDIVPWGGSEE